MEAIMNLKDRHTIQEPKTLFRTEKNARLARRIHGVYLAARGLGYPPAVWSIILRQQYQTRSLMTTTNGSVHIVIFE